MTKIISQKEKGNHRHWKNFLDKNYLGSHNLEKGEEMLLTIAKFVGEEEVQSADGSKSIKMVLYFQEEMPKMILNVTNATTISSLYGSHPDGWTGKKIQIYAANVKAFGRMQDALRIRDFVPKIEVDIEKHTALLRTSKNLNELKTLWDSLPKSAQSNAAVIKVKDDLKELLTNQ